ncbi:MAG TPA: dihydrolipoamide acetyltransferase family protein, partial [Acidimicrobiia bacterium]|nr:dihydrolipoamide acetyltransferase family protein [Acidimicrobiia bacterium]
MPVHTKAGEEAVVTAWMVDEGAVVKAGQLIAEVQVEKVALDVLAPADGVVTGLVPINQPVPQGEPICLIGEAAPGPVEGRGPASPAARRLARELGVELATVRGTGPGGRITEADVTAAAAGGPAPGFDLTGLRSAIARNLRRSRAETAAFTITTTADVTDRVPRQITAWVLQAVGRALRRHPHLNGQRSDDRFILSEKVNVSLAIQTEAGLVAPVVRDVAAKTVEEIASLIETLAAKARTRQLETADFEGGTFSVSNLGSYGIDTFTPLINLPQIAILGVGAIRTVPGLGPAGQAVPRQQLTLSLTVDHAFVDGAPA